MDHAEEQEMELQACEAIYGDDFKKLEEGALPAFEVVLVPEAGAGEDVNHVAVAMKIAFTPTYPEAAPELSLRFVRCGGLQGSELAECEQQLRDAAGSEELLGTAMVYMLAEQCTEWLAAHNKPEMDMHQEMMVRLKAQEASQPAVDVSEDGAEQAASLVDLHKKGRKGAKSGAGEGSWRADTAADAAAAASSHTPVTVESFAMFRKEWEAQRAAAKAAKAAKTAKAQGRNTATTDDGLTGRQLFERSGGTLIDTDAGALEDGEEDMMSAPRAAADASAEGATAGAENNADGVGCGASASSDAALLATIGDEALFDEDEDEELPSDDD